MHPNHRRAQPAESGGQSANREPAGQGAAAEAPTAPAAVAASTSIETSTSAGPAPATPTPTPRAASDAARTTATPPPANPATTLSTATEARTAAAPVAAPASPQSYHKRARTYCDATVVGMDNAYATLPAAQQACDQTTGCTGVADGQCDGPPFTLCETTKASSQGSCTWLASVHGAGPATAAATGASASPATTAAATAPDGGGTAVATAAAPSSAAAAAATTTAAAAGATTSACAHLAKNSGAKLTVEFDCEPDTMIKGAADVPLCDGSMAGFDRSHAECEAECTASAACKSYVYKERNGKGDFRGYCELWSQTTGAAPSKSGYVCARPVPLAALVPATTPCARTQ